MRCVRHFYQAYCYIVQALGLIGYHRHLDKYGDTYADWDTANRTVAQQILASITSFAFIVSFTCAYQYLSLLARITVKLQKRSLDIIDAHELIAEVTATYEGERNDVDISFRHIYQQSVRMAESVSTTPEMPRITGRQQHHSNPSSFSVEDYFKKTVAIPLLDHIITSMRDRFSTAAIVASSLLGVVPSVCCSREESY